MSSWFFTPEKLGRATRVSGYRHSHEKVGQNLYEYCVECDVKVDGRIVTEGIGITFDIGPVYSGSTTRNNHRTNRLAAIQQLAHEIRMTYPE
jgi:hypothetical protein